MAVWTVNQLKQHLGHDVNLTDYAGEVCVVCDDCNEILLEFHDKAYYDKENHMGDYITLGPEPEE